MIAAPDGAVAVAPFENPGLATGGTGDVLAGHDRGAPRPGPGALRRRAPRRPPPRHGRRGGPGPRGRRGAPRRRPAARDRPRAPAPRRDAERRAGRAASASAARGRAAGPPAGRRAAAPRDGPAGRGRAPASRPASGPRGCRALPRTAWLEIDLGPPRGERRRDPGGAAARGAPGGRRQGRRLRPRRGAGRARPPLAAGARGLCVATLDEALELRAAGVRRPDPRPLRRSRPTAPRPRRGPACEITAGDAGLLERALAAYAACPPARAARAPAARRPARASRPGSGRDGLTPARRSRRPAAIAATPGVVPARRVVAPPGARATGPAPTRQVGPLRGGRRRAAAGRASRCPTATSSPRAACSRSSGSWRVERPVFDGLRVGLAAYGIVPDGPRRSAPAATGIHAGLRPVLSLRARPIRVADLPGGHRDQLRADVRHGPPEPDRDAPGGLRATAGRGPSRTGPRPSSAAMRVPLVGQRGDGRGHGGRHRRPRPAGHAGRRVRAPRRARAATRSRAAELAQERTTISWEVVSTMSRRMPRVYTARAVAVGIRTLTEDRGTWRSSRSGTATSATSRSTRS